MTSHYLSLRQTTFVIFLYLINKKDHLLYYICTCKIGLQLILLSFLLFFIDLCITQLQKTSNATQYLCYVYVLYKVSCKVHALFSV